MIVTTEACLNDQAGSLSVRFMSCWNVVHIPAKVRLKVCAAAVLRTEFTDKRLLGFCLCNEAGCNEIWPKNVLKLTRVILTQNAIAYYVQFILEQIAYQFFPSNL